MRDLRKGIWENKDGWHVRCIQEWQVGQWYSEEAATREQYVLVAAEEILRGPWAHFTSREQVGWNTGGRAAHGPEGWFWVLRWGAEPGRSSFKRLWLPVPCPPMTQLSAEKSDIETDFVHHDVSTAIKSKWAHARDCLFQPWRTPSGEI